MFHVYYGAGEWEKHFATKGDAIAWATGMNLESFFVLDSDGTVLDSDGTVVAVLDSDGTVVTLLDTDGTVIAVLDSDGTVVTGGFPMLQ